MRQYLDLMREIRDEGAVRGDRTGVGTRSVFGRQMRMDLTAGFPLLTTKRVPLRLVAEELAWFLRGETNVRVLQERNVHIWNEWADADGELGPVYGAQWRAWQAADGRAVDQLGALAERIGRDPESRRHVVSAWNVGALEEMALPPCHLLFQAYVEPGWLSLQCYMRSADLFLGVPFNIASYALLAHVLARGAGLEAKALVMTFGDVHLYRNHSQVVERQLEREPRPLPRLVLSQGCTGVDGFEAAHAAVEGYDPYGALKAPVAV